MSEPTPRVQRFRRGARVQSHRAGSWFVIGLVIGLATLQTFVFLAAAQAVVPVAPAGTTLPPALELEIGGYEVRLWSEEGGGEDRLEITSPAGRVVEVVDAFITIGGQVRTSATGVPEALEPGVDLNGNGVPDLVVEGFSGGAHCCFSYYIVELGSEPRLLWQADTADASLVFEDLDGDGTFEALTNDMSYAYRFCSFAFSPAPLVILDLGEDGVEVANLDFPDAYAAEVMWALDAALRGPMEGEAEEDACVVAQLVLNLLYSGRTETARLALERFYNGEDGAAFMTELLRVARASDWFEEAPE